MELTYTSVKSTQPLNAPRSIVSTLAGISILEMLEQPLNACFEILWTDSGIVTTNGQ